MPTVVISENTTHDFTGTDDVKLKESTPTTNLEDQNLEVTSFASGDRATSLVRFTGLSNITGPVTVSSATLSLFHTDNNGTNTVDVHRCLRAWVAAQATWNVYSTGNSWTTAGGVGTGTDIVTTASASAAITGTGSYQDWTSSQLAQDVQDWINGVNTNNGWLLKRNDFSAFNSTFDGFTDGVNGTPASCPKLTFTYTSSGGTSTATVMWMKA